MKTLLVTLIAAASAVVMVLPAGAQEATPDHPTAYTGTLSRDAVRAAAIEARAAGQIADGERSIFVAAVGTPATRAQVVAELHEARRLGLLADGERTVLPSESQLQSIRGAGLRAGSIAVAVRP